MKIEMSHLPLALTTVLAPVARGQSMPLKEKITSEELGG